MTNTPYEENTVMAYQQADATVETRDNLLEKLGIKQVPCKIFCPECGQAYYGDALTPCNDCQSMNKTS